MLKSEFEKWVFFGFANGVRFQTWGLTHSNNASVSCLVVFSRLLSSEFGCFVKWMGAWFPVRKVRVFSEIERDVYVGEFGVVS